MKSAADDGIEDLLRRLAPQVLAAVVRQYGNFETAEDAVQEALLAAATQWPEDGLPDRPDAWLIRVASRRLTDLLRSEEAGRRREEKLAALREPEAAASSQDDTLTLLMLCCHPSLTPGTQVALTLRAVGGLTTAEIARAFLVPETTMAQRISRAKQRIKSAGATFGMPPEAERPERTRSVLQVLYLIFNEGYTATSGPDLHRTDLTAEAIRLARQLPEDGETSGLLALMLLTDSRRPARTTPSDGALVPLAEQDRALWNQESINEGLTLIAHALANYRVGPYQLQAAIAAVHAEAKTAADTDWPQILALYELLTDLDPNPIVTLNKAVALAMVEGPRPGLSLLESLDSELGQHHRLHAVRAHLLEMAGERDAARDAYRTAARLTTSIPEQRYLRARADKL
ncbi:sigma-70 family RNA polymerase sigma factor [Actinomadura barringtoniae]|uniref:Sigma-70 family RNA polymerase sigma factor n=1 Tax=Actinomadura barringtoniae TaxID=1427535 RepID=A0A939PN14_9ACTN|nr:sigma-70 family RNA polymerase sigma factor [Actinomadura barringtoniae]MBO2451576.1 sigma-70 family RNA polymerase sigma factor [Actinomadura barringtoniae]